MLNLVSLDGKTFDFKSLQGKKLIVSFSASWCGDCLKELKTLNKIKAYELEDTEVICISDESIQTITEWQQKKGYPFVFLKMQQSFNKVGIHVLPTTYLLNKKMEIVTEQTGYIRWDDPSTLQHLRSLF